MITIIDAVMGKGKTTYMIERLNSELDQKFIILLPGTTEVDKYEKDLSRSDVVAIYQDKGEPGSVTSQFLKAVRDGKSVICTHSLFPYLGIKKLEELGNIGEYTLIIDETIVLVDGYEAQEEDLKTLKILKFVETVDHPIIEGLEYYRKTSLGDNYAGSPGGVLKEIMQAVAGEHVYRVDKHNVVFIVPPEKFTIFKDVFLMTYLFDGSETNAWLDLFSLSYEHKELNKSLSGTFSLKPHDRTYSGSTFKPYLELYDGSLNKVGDKKGKSLPLTSSWYKRESKKVTLVKSVVKRKKGPDKVPIEVLRNNTRTFYRDAKVDKRDMLWTCPIGCRDLIRQSHFDPLKKPYVTFLVQTERGTNDYDDRNTLAFLIDVYPPVEIGNFFKLHKLCFNPDRFALSRVLQWTWRSAIRKSPPEPVTLYLPSERMRELVSEWLK